MESKQDLVNSFEESLFTVLKSKAYRKICQKRLGLDIRTYSMITRSDIDYIQKTINESKPKEVLEVGCGSGDLIKFICDTYDIKCCGTELSTNIVNCLNNQDNVKLNYLVEDIDIGLNSKKYDLVLCIDVLYFVFDLEKSILNLVNMISNTGLALIYFSDHKESTYKYKVLSKYLDKINYKYDIINITNNEKEFWKDLLFSVTELSNEFSDEGNSELYKSLVEEAEKSLKMNELYNVQRYCYIVYGRDR